MATYSINCYRDECTTIVVEAKNYNEAIEKALRKANEDINTLDCSIGDFKVNKQLSEKISRFNVGDKVHWIDPAKDDYETDADYKASCERVFTIQSIEPEMISLSDGVSYVECYDDELITAK